MTPEEVVRSTGRTLLVARWVSSWLDMAAIVLILAITQSVLGRELYRSLLPIWMLFLVAYFPILEGRWGVTLGRLLTRTIVVDAQGNPPGVSRAAIRTVARVIEVNPFLFGGVIAAIAVLTSPARQRLGDRWAGTFVLRRSELQLVMANGSSVLASAEPQGA